MDWSAALQELEAGVTREEGLLASGDGEALRKEAERLRSMVLAVQELAAQTQLEQANAARLAALLVRSRQLEAVAEKIMAEWQKETVRLGQSQQALRSWGGHQQWPDEGGRVLDRKR